MSRLNKVQPAVRPKMHGRAMITGPSGGGKTFTALRMALKLTDGDPTKILGIDTERESMLTYADVFGAFGHLPWAPPYDASELASVLDEVDGDQYRVVLVDTFSKFWQGQGGVLDVADGKFGGWKVARPVQERLVEQVLAVPAHVILCVRSKMAYSAETGANGKQTVTRLGLSPIQDDNLVYEMNIAVDIDMEHRITVTKSRTNAVPVGRMYPAGLEQKLAEDYREWLDGGVPPAAREDIDRIVGRFAEVVDADERTRLKTQFKETFGMPHSITALQVADAEAWLAAHVGSDNVDSSTSNEEAKPEETATSPSEPPEAPSATGTPTEPVDAPTGHTEAQKPLTMGDLAQATAEEVAERAKRVNEYCLTQPVEIVEALGESHGARFLEGEGQKARRQVIATVLVSKGWDPDVSDAGWRELAEA